LPGVKPEKLDCAILTHGAPRTITIASVFTPVSPSASQFAITAKWKE
jgi:hypothetical protein